MVARLEEILGAIVLRLLGMALHPQFNKNGQLFVNYIDQDDFSIISRFPVNFQIM